MNSSIVSEKDPVKRSNKPSLYWIISHGIISLRGYLHLEGETPSLGIGPWKKPCPPRLFIPLKSESNSKTLECQLEMQN